MIEKQKDNIKNLIGWRTKRKIIVIAADDYGNVRVNSKKAYDVISKNNTNSNRFDKYDSLETRQDLELLYDTLSVVKDCNNRYVVFTPFALTHNMNFEQMQEYEWEQYISELLPETFKKLSALDSKAYEGAWELWQEGITSGLMAPQFHGREHFNLKLVEEKLKLKDPLLLSTLNNRSLCNIDTTDYLGLKWTAAFAFRNLVDDTKGFEEVIRVGTTAFEKIYGYKATVFTPPAQQLPSFIEKELPKYGIKVLDRPFYQSRHLGNGKYKKELNTTGFKPKKDLVYMIRNVVFEPTNGNIDHVAKALDQIEAAFRWHRPAIISSHRVNFCGHIDPNNRKTGIEALKFLLTKVVKRWPEVEFMAANELGDLIAAKN